MVDFKHLLMENKNMSNKQSVFGCGKFDEPDSEYLKFDESNTVSYTMLQNEPTVLINKFGKEQYTFEVLNNDTKTVMNHSITSVRYMRQLDPHAPLEGKSFCVKRTGEEMKTTYKVELLQGK